MAVTSIDVSEHAQGLSPKHEAMISWGSSGLLHAGAALLLVAALYAINKHKVESFIEVPVEISNGGKEALQAIERKSGTGIPVEIDGTPREAMQNLIQNVPDHGQDPLGNLDGNKDELSALMGSEAPSMISLGAGGGNPKGASGTPFGNGAGKTAMWGSDNLFPQGPQGTGGPGTGGERGRPAKVVFVLDHSGSMIDTFDFLREEVKRVVRGFAPAQEFAVVMFSEDALVLGPNQLQRALSSVKINLMDRLDGVRAAGKNDDLLEPFTKALGKAFAMKPTKIVFLTDGKFDEALPGAIRKMNPDGKVRIDTIAFVNIQKVSEIQLQEIARDNGGNYRFVSERDLGK